MRRQLVLAFIVTVLTATNVGAQEWAEKMFEKRSHDFGTVPRGGHVQYAFKLKNLYEEDVHISSVRSSCGCTTPKVTKDTLKTFEEGEILAEFNTRNFLGYRSATVTVTFDKPFYATVQLNVSGYIRSDVVLDPGSVQFGSVDQGTAGEKTIDLEYAGRDDWTITEVKVPSPYLEARAEVVARQGGLVTYKIHSRLKEDAPPGYLKEQITLVTNDTRAKFVPVMVEARVLPEVTVTPANLFLGVLQPGQKVTKQLLVRGKRPFKIKDVKCENDSFVILATDKIDQRHLVPVTFTAGEQPGKVACEITIETDTGVTASFLAHAQVVAGTAAAK